MATQKIAPAAITALIDALSNVYHFKKDLRIFLESCVRDSHIVAQLDWNDYKRNIVATLVQRLAQQESLYQEDILRLMMEVAGFSDFKHLERLEDGQRKASKAKETVATLRTLIAPHTKLIEEQRKADERRAKTKDSLNHAQGIKDKLEQIKKSVYDLLSLPNPQSRGYKLEKILNDLFLLFDLNPKAPFKIEGEQIDGAFTLDNTEYILEAKWQDPLVERADLDIFNQKISRKLENTLGLFFSFNGFEPNALLLHSTNRPKMICMDGADLMAVLDQRIDLVQLLMRKRRHASVTGQIFLPFRDF